MYCGHLNVRLGSSAPEDAVTQVHTLRCAVCTADCPKELAPHVKVQQLRSKGGIGRWILEAHTHCLLESYARCTISSLQKHSRPYSVP